MPIYGRISLDRTFYNFFVNIKVAAIAPWIYLIALFLLLVILIFLFVGQQRKENNKSVSTYLVLIHFTFILGYFLFLLLSISFYDAATPMDHRILFPVLASTLFLFVATLFTLIPPRAKPVFITFMLLVLLQTALQSSESWRFLLPLYQRGFGYQRVEWRLSPTVNYLLDIPPGPRIYTNGRDIIYYRTDHKAHRLPAKFASTSLTQNGNYEAEMDQLCSEVLDGAMIVYFDLVSRRYLPDPMDIERHCQIQPLLTFNDGRIYRAE